MEAANSISDSAGKTPQQLAFEFVTALASELSGGKIDLPSFPDVPMSRCPDSRAPRALK